MWGVCVGFCMCFMRYVYVCVFHVRRVFSVCVNVCDVRCLRGVVCECVCMSCMMCVVLLCVI